mgnify:CR=1 FL=1
MSAPPPDSGPLPDDEDKGGDLDEWEEGVPSGEAAGDPESARQEAEDALARIEAMADLDAEPEAEASGEASGASASTEAGSEGTRTAGSPSETSGGGHGRPEDQCENCGALLEGPYCSQCGQKAADRIVPLWHMVNEALEAVFELDLRVLHTFPKFLFLPGRLTKEYLNGRRKRYIRPFRLYLFTTFLLFTVIAFTTTGGVQLPFPPAAAPTTADTTQASAARPPLAAPDPTTPEALRAQPQESSMFGSQEERNQVATKIEQDTGRFEVNIFGTPAANERTERLLRRKLAQAVRNPWEFIEGIVDRGPYVMFFMLPLFAFLLKLLYIRRGRLYMEHMIFSLHVHAHAFFAFTVGILMAESSVGWVNTASIFVDLSPLLYLIMAMAHVYDQGWIKSTFKAFLLLLLYSFVLVFGLIGLLFVALLLM